METEKSRVKGYYASRTTIEGEVIVITKPLDLLSIEPLSGTFESAHEHGGKNIKDKILVAPCLCGATIAEFIPLFLSLTGNKPKAFVTTTTHAYTPIMSGCIISETPLIYGLDKKLAEKLETGDKVKINAKNEEITIQK